MALLTGVGTGMKEGAVWIEWILIAALVVMVAILLWKNYRIHDDLRATKVVVDTINANNP